MEDSTRFLSDENLKDDHDESSLGSDIFPPKPDEPLPSDCCGTGCSPCVFDLYKKDLEEWENACNKIRMKVNSTDNNNLEKDKQISQSKFMGFKLIKVKRLTHDTNLYSFEIPWGGTLGCKIGQHLILQGKSPDNKPITRQYTPISPPDREGSFDVIIKLYRDGKMSQYVSQLKEGDITLWRGPFGDFKYKRNEVRTLVALAAGTGIAPILPIAKSIAADEQDETLVKLLYAVRTKSDILLKEDLQELSSYWNFTVKMFISDEDIKSHQHSVIQMYSGRISKEDIESDIKDGVKILICGTRSFEKDMLKYVKQLNVDDSLCVRF